MNTIQSDVNEIASRASADLWALRNTNVVVTGGAGFLLSYLVDTIAHYASTPEGKGTRVTVVDNFTTGIPDRIAHLKTNPAVSFVTADVSKPLSLDLADASHIVHGASIASPIVYRRYPIETAEVNALGTHNLLRYIVEKKHRSLKSFVLLSTSEVYGDPDPSHVPTSETYRGSVSCTGPRACYDESKRFAETLAVLFHQVHGVPTRMVRPFNVYGPGMRLDDGRVLPDFVRAMLQRENIIMFSDGSPKRSFCYVTDFIVGFLAVMVRGQGGEPYNVGSDVEEISMRQVAELVASLGDGTTRVECRASQDSHYLTDNPQRRCPDLAKLRSLTTFIPKVGMKEGLLRYIQWAKETGELRRIGSR